MIIFSRLKYKKNKYKKIFNKSSIFYYVKILLVFLNIDILEGFQKFMFNSNYKNNINYF